MNHIGRIPGVIGEQGAHIYDLEVMTRGDELATVEVIANNADQARSKAVKAGYLVRSVNMTG